MIKKLLLENIALIDRSEIDFCDGLNVLSGETGSGKSVILDSINFVLGAKADKSMIRYGSDYCQATAVFSFEEKLRPIFDELGVEIDEEIIIKRRFSTDGKGYIKVNGETFNVNMLRKITSNLVDVHGQSEHYALLKESNQLELIDRYGGNSIDKVKNELLPITTELKEVNKQLTSLGGSENDRAIRLDILKYQINEIEKAELKDGEEEELQQAKLKIKNFEKIFQALSKTYGSLSDDGCVLDLLNSAEKNISSLSGIDSEYAKISDRLSNIREEVNDISESVNDMLSKLDTDGLDADRIEERLELIHGLKRKYGNGYSEIMTFYDNAVKEFDKLSNFEKNAEELIKRKKDLQSKLFAKYDELTEERKKVSQVFTSKVVDELQELAMKHCRFEVQFSKIDSEDYVSSSGNDNVCFMFSANLGEPLKDMSKVISGGEMSRFMLGMKSVVCDLQEISTFIFDEIDTGVSGAVAETVAEKFAKISKHKQIIAISHLAQICAMSDSSILISKYEDDAKTYTTAKKLDENQKVLEIIRLIGGDANSQSAKAHASDMINSAILYKNSL